MAEFGTFKRRDLASGRRSLENPEIYGLASLPVLSLCFLFYGPMHCLTLYKLCHSHHRGPPPCLGTTIIRNLLCFRYFVEAMRKVTNRPSRLILLRIRNVQSHLRSKKCWVANDLSAPITTHAPNLTGRSKPCFLPAPFGMLCSFPPSIQFYSHECKG